MKGGAGTELRGGGGASVAGIYTPRRRGRPRAIFFSTSTSSNPRGPTNPSSRLARATGYTQNAGQTTINTFSQAGWQAR